MESRLSYLRAAPKEEGRARIEESSMSPQRIQAIPPQVISIFPRLVVAAPSIPNRCPPFFPFTREHCNVAGEGHSPIGAVGALAESIEKDEIAEKFLGAKHQSVVRGDEVCLPSVNERKRAKMKKMGKRGESGGQTSGT